jgi:hypothetical protein
MNACLAEIKLHCPYWPRQTSISAPEKLNTVEIEFKNSLTNFPVGKLLHSISLHCQTDGRQAC